MIEIKGILNNVEEVLTNDLKEQDDLINQFFDLLFWKNYANGYVNPEDKQKILSEIKNSQDKMYNYSKLDTKKILPFINKIRRCINLPELTLEFGHGLLEMTPRVKKEIMIRRLK